MSQKKLRFCVCVFVIFEHTKVQLYRSSVGSIKVKQAYKK
jgi:hypothetical protein